MASAQDRKNQLVWESIDVAAYKQALQLCNRRIKKGEKGDYLMMLKAHVLTLLPPSSANYAEALGICRAIADRKTPVDDVDVAMFVQRVWALLEDSGVGEKGACSRECGKIWEAAVKARLGDERMAKEWVFGCLRGKDWRGMQKAAMHLQKQFPKKREYYFWAILSCLLLHNSLPETSNERKLFGMLAYRMIIKAKDEVPPEANNPLLPPRALHNAQDVHLLLSIITSASSAPNPREKALEALSVLDSANLGLESSIAKGDYLGLLRRKLVLLNELGKWYSLWKFCGGLLRKAREPEETSESQAKSDLPKIGDDWALWENYLHAAGELLSGESEGKDEGGMDKEDLKKETLRTVLEYVEPGDTSKPTRNSELALVKWASLFHGKSEQAPEGTPSLVEACWRYFKSIGNKNCCFEDLGRYVEVFDETEQDEFLSHLKEKERNEGDVATVTVARVAEQINIQKFVYFLRISPLPLIIPQDETSRSDLERRTKALNLSDSNSTTLKEFLDTALTRFAATNIQIYLSALTPSLSSSLIVTDNQYGDDAALLAVMALLRLWKLDNGSNEAPLLRAVFILEMLLTKSKHNYQALLLLTRIYLLIGVPYLAASNHVWGKLNVKQIQTDTLGHWLLTRGSTIFPSALTLNQDSLLGADLLNHINKGLMIYDSNRKQTPEMTVLALDRGTYGQILDFVEFERRLEGSVARGMYEVDKRRAERFRGISVGGEDNLTVPWRLDMLGVGENGNIVDNRDLGVLVNFERKGQRAEEKFLRIGSELPGVRWTKAFSLVEEVVNIASGVKCSDSPKRLGEIETALAGMIEDDSGADEGKKEFTSEEKSYLSLAGTLCKILLCATSDPAQYIQHLDTITTFFKKPTSVRTLPGAYSWRTLHGTYTAFESALLASIVLTKGIKPQVMKLKGQQGQKAKQTFQELISSVLPGYVKLAKEAFGEKNLSGVEEAQGVINGIGSEKGGDGFGGVFLAGKEGFGGEDHVGKVFERIVKGRKEMGEGVKKWVL